MTCGIVLPGGRFPDVTSKPLATGRINQRRVSAIAAAAAAAAPEPERGASEAGFMISGMRDLRSKNRAGPLVATPPRKTLRFFS